MFANGEHAHIPTKRERDRDTDGEKLAHLTSRSRETASGLRPGRSEVLTLRLRSLASLPRLCGISSGTRFDRSVHVQEMPIRGRHPLHLKSRDEVSKHRHFLHIRVCVWVADVRRFRPVRQSRNASRAKVSMADNVY